MLGSNHVKKGRKMKKVIILGMFLSLTACSGFDIPLIPFI